MSALPAHDTSASSAPANTMFTGAAALLKATLRHDARLLAPWIALVTLLSMSSVVVYPWVFPDQAEREALQATIGANPAMGLIFGPANNLTTVDGFNAWRSLAIGGFLAALGAILAVIRATRGQEDSGQAELLASGVLGRESRLMVATAMAFIGSLVLGALAALATVPFGGGWQATLLLGAGFTVTGWMFTAIAAVTAQVGADARTASSLAVGTLGTLFIMRGFVQSVDAPAWTLWINPLGWIQETAPASGNNWWPLLLAVALTLALLVLAFTLEARRDFGQGAIVPRPGPGRGATGGPIALALRLNRGTIVTWMVAFVLLGIVFGYFVTAISDLADSGGGLQQMLASGAMTSEQVISGFLVTVLSLVGIFAAIGGVQVLTRVRSEEQADRLEPIIATVVGRRRYLASNVAVSLGAAAVNVAIATVGMGVLVANANIGVSFADVWWQATVMVPAVWTAIAVAAAVVGARPRVIMAAWVGVVVSFVLTLLGPTFGLANWVLGINPFWHVPHIMTDNPNWAGLGWISLVTLGLIAVGLAGFRRRDLAV